MSSSSRPPAHHPAPETEGLERLDVEAAAAAARHRHKPWVKTLGAISEVADQIPLATVCGVVIAGGMAGGRPDIARTGVRMMAAHVLANVVKRGIKNRLRRTRPAEAVTNREYQFEPGETEGGHDTSFPSGHTAGAVAVARIVAGDMPPLAVPVLGFAALIAAVQIPRGKHYPADVAAGTALGLAAAWAVDRLLPGHTLLQSEENLMSDNATTSISALFETREAADQAIEHLVQQHGFDRADIFAEAEGTKNTVGNRPSGGDSDDADDAAALHGAIRVSADVESDQAGIVESTFRELGGRNIAHH